MIPKTAEGLKPRFFRSQEEFRKWLESNHSRVDVMWVGFYNQRSTRKGITYKEALDEALCFGWIDGVRLSVDDTRYTMRFTPRRPGSVWSPINTKRVKELIAEKRVSAAGVAAFEKRDPAKSEKLYAFQRNEYKFDAAVEEQFKKAGGAWEFFESQAPWYRRMSAYWVLSAKREETRERRLGTLIADCAKGKRIDKLTSAKNKK